MIIITEINKKLYDPLIVYQGPSDSDKTNFNLCVELLTFYKLFRGKYSNYILLGKSLNDQNIHSVRVIEHYTQG